MQLQIERLLDKSYLEEAQREVKRQKHSMIEQDNAYEEEAEVLARALAQQSKDFSSRRKKNLDISVYVEREQKKEDDKKKKKSDEDALVEMQSVEEREAAVQEEEEKEFRKLYPLLVDGVGRVLFSAVKSVRQGFRHGAWSEEYTSDTMVMHLEGPSLETFCIVNLEDEDCSDSSLIRSPFLCPCLFIYLYN